MWKRACLLVGLCAACASTVPEPVSYESPLPVVPMAAGEGGSGEAPRRYKKEHDEKVGHHVTGLFLGGSIENERDGFTIGVDYEYRVSELIGVGAFAEYAAGNLDTAVLGGAVYVHPWKELTFVVGPGVEFQHGDGDAMARLGALYEFPVGPVGLAPSFYLDLVSGGEQVYVFGLTIIKSW